MVIICKDVHYLQPSNSISRFLLWKSQAHVHKYKDVAVGLELHTIGNNPKIHHVENINTLHSNCAIEYC